MRNTHTMVFLYMYKKESPHKRVIRMTKTREEEQDKELQLSEGHSE